MKPKQHKLKADKSEEGKLQCEVDQLCNDVGISQHQLKELMPQEQIPRSIPITQIIDGMCQSDPQAARYDDEYKQLR